MGQDVEVMGEAAEDLLEVGWFAFDHVGTKDSFLPCPALIMTQDACLLLYVWPIKVLFPFSNNLTILIQHLKEVENPSNEPATSPMSKDHPLSLSLVSDHQLIGPRAHRTAEFNDAAERHDILETIKGLQIGEMSLLGGWRKMILINIEIIE